MYMVMSFARGHYEQQGPSLLTYPDRTDPWS